MQGFVSLYDYEKRKCVVRRNTPPLPDFRLLLDDQVKSGTIIYVTCPERHEKLTAVTALKYSPIGKSFVSWYKFTYRITLYIFIEIESVFNVKHFNVGDLIACGLENGTVWMLHPITLEPLDENPYKHSTQSILQFAFTECEEYMAYAVNIKI